MESKSTERRKQYRGRASFLLQEPTAHLFLPLYRSGLLVLCRFLCQSFIVPLCHPVECPAVQDDEQGEEERTREVAS